MRPALVCRFLVSTAIAAVPLASQAPPKSPAEVVADSLLKAGNARAALHGYQQIVHGDSTNFRAWFGVGNAAYAAHNDSLAARAFARVGAARPNATAMYNAGSIYARLHMTDSAFFWLDKALTAGFSVPSLFTSDSDLTSIRTGARFAALVQRAKDVAAPCLANPDARRFDFWVGEWEVTPANATVVVGHSVVQVVSGGCALLENWTASNGSEGKSLNSYNAGLAHWEQFWVGQQGGVTEYRDSHWEDGTIVYLAHSLTAQGAPFDQRLSFSPIDANTVRQHGELSTDGGKSWSTTYDFYYHRKK